MRLKVKQRLKKSHSIKKGRVVYNQKIQQKILIVEWDDIIRAIKDISNQIERSKYSFNSIVAIQRGGLIPAVMLSHFFGIRDMEVISVQRTSTDNLQADTHTPRISPIEYDYSGKKVLIVDDIVGEGDTIQLVKGKLNNCLQVKVASLYINICKCKCNEEIDYHFADVNLWVLFPWERNQ